MCTVNTSDQVAQSPISKRGAHRPYVTITFLTLLFLSTLGASAAGVVINEIMYHPQSENSAEEFIEIYNSGSTPVHLLNWQFVSGVAFQFTNDIVLPADAYWVVAADLGTFQLKHPGVTNVTGGWQGTLGNGGERIRLIDAASNDVDSLTYSDDGNWGTRIVGPVDFGHRGLTWNTDADGGGKSIELLNPKLSRDEGGNWAPSAAVGGSPGAANSGRSSDIAPLISFVSHVPAVPTSTTPITISCKVTDEALSGVKVTMQWRLDGETSFRLATLLDDGVIWTGRPAMEFMP